MSLRAKLSYAYVARFFKYQWKENPMLVVASVIGTIGFTGFPLAWLRLYNRGAVHYMHKLDYAVVRKEDVKDPDSVIFN